MSKKMVRTISIAMMLMMVMSVFSMVFADIPIDEINGITGGDDTAYGAAKKGVNTVLGIVQIVGAGIAVIMLIVLAIKYISASPNDKAEIKKHAVVYIVGAICLFGATGILQIIRNFTEDALPEGTQTQ